jgi:hypothetical protein
MPTAMTQKQWRRWANSVVVALADEWDLHVGELVSTSVKTKTIADARRALMALLREWVCMRGPHRARQFALRAELSAEQLEHGGWEAISLPQMSRLIGGRNHTTVLRMLRLAQYGSGADRLRRLAARGQELQSAHEGQHRMDPERFGPRLAAERA